MAIQKNLDLFKKNTSSVSQQCDVDNYFKWKNVTIKHNLKERLL